MAEEDSARAAQRPRLEPEAYLANEGLRDLAHIPISPPHIPIPKRYADTGDGHGTSGRDDADSTRLISFRVLGPPSYLHGETGTCTFTIDLEKYLSFKVEKARTVDVYLTLDRRADLLELVDAKLHHGETQNLTLSPEVDTTIVNEFSPFNRRRYTWHFTPRNSSDHFVNPENIVFSSQFNREFGSGDQNILNIVDISVLIEEKKADPDPSVRSFGGATPVGALVHIPGEDGTAIKYTYLGCSMDRDRVFLKPQDDVHHVTKSFDEVSKAEVVDVPARPHFFKSAPQVQDPAEPALNEDTDISKHMTRATFNLLARLSSATIRGKSVLKLLRHLHQQGGTPVFVVGGAVRDAFLGDDINDIDLAVAKPYDDLKADITRFFRESEPLKEGETLLCDATRKSFGMMKVVKKEGDKDHLDVGVFKSGYETDKDIAMYGYSPLDDAFQRDYTINAVYLDVFRGSLYDPFGALPHILTGLKKPMSFFPCAARAETLEERDKILERDFGGCLRVFKMLRKTIPGPTLERRAYTIEPGKFVFFVPVFKRLIQKAKRCSKAANRVADKTRTSDKRTDLEEIDYVFTKIAKKLFKKDDHAFKDIWKCTDHLAPDEANKDKDQTTCERNCKEFWSIISSVAQQINESLRAEDDVFKFESDDFQKDDDETRENRQNVLDAIQAIAGMKIPEVAGS